MAIISFRPKQVSKKLLNSLKDRSFDVIANRYGLTDDAERKTLEAIGQKYGITRERVRQIENSALNTIRKSKEMEESKEIFDEIRELLRSMGSVVSEDEFLEHVSKDKSIQNHVHLYMILDDEFHKEKEGDEFRTCWFLDDPVINEVHEALRKLHASIHDDELYPENKIVEKFLGYVKNIEKDHNHEDVAKRWLRLSKKIGKNPLNEWGNADSKNVKTRGVKDYTFLVMRRHGEPMHFREVAEAITKTFNRKTLAATTHNELIKDPRFVLVGRGRYALREWGYKPGIVREIIAGIIKENGPMDKDEIVDAVLKERFLKRNTIIVNLHNAKYFKKTKTGKYDNVSSK